MTSTTGQVSLLAAFDASGGQQNKWVTTIATSQQDGRSFVSGGRDKNVRLWELEDGFGGGVDGEESPVFQRRAMRGHSHFVSDVTLSTDGQFALSSSWDSTLRLWDLSTGECTRRFVSHTKDVMSVAFSPDNRQIVSGGRDGAIKLWNTLGECKYTFAEDGHDGWVNTVRFSPNDVNPIIVSGGDDKLVKVWNLTDFKLRCNLVGHTGVVNTVTVSPDGSLCASGGKDGMAMLWDLGEGRLLYSLNAESEITALVFSPNRYWLCAATTRSIKIWDLESKQVVDDIRPDFPPLGPKAVAPFCVSLAWNVDGSLLFSGWTDGQVRVWRV